MGYNKHGHSLVGKRSMIYGRWLSLKQRCLNPKCKEWKHYGGRGIKICERWLDFELFFQDVGNPPPGHSLDRINNNGNYEPGNCRWATQKEQMNNSRSKHLLTLNGQTKGRTEWAKTVGISCSALQYRLDVAGWSLERALSSPKSREYHGGSKPLTPDPMTEGTPNLPI